MKRETERYIPSSPRRTRSKRVERRRKKARLNRKTRKMFQRAARAHLKRVQKSNEAFLKSIGM